MRARRRAEARSRADAADPGIEEQPHRPLEDEKGGAYVAGDLRGQRDHGDGPAFVGLDLAGQPIGQYGHLRARALERHGGPPARDHEQEASPRAVLRRGLERKPQLLRAEPAELRGLESGRHHAEDRVWRPADRERAPDDRGIGAEPPSPQAVAQDDDA